MGFGVGGCVGCGVGREIMVVDIEGLLMAGWCSLSGWQWGLTFSGCWMRSAERGGHSFCGRVLRVVDRDHRIVA
jgi:hypothetical protein